MAEGRSTSYVTPSDVTPSNIASETFQLRIDTPSANCTFEKLHLWTLQLRMFHLREFYLWDITPSICHTFASHSLKYFVRLDQDSGRGRREIRPVTQLFACPGFCSERGAACHQQWWPEKKCVLILIENLGIIMACL